MKTLKKVSVMVTTLALYVAFFLTSKAGILSDSNCNNIEEIKTKVTSSMDRLNNGKLEIIIPEGLSIENLKIHLFAPLRDNNRFDIKAKVIDRLSKGRYYLMVQSKDGDCTRKITLEIN